MCLFLSVLGKALGVRGCGETPSGGAGIFRLRAPPGAMFRAQLIRRRAQPAFRKDGETNYANVPGLLVFSLGVSVADAAKAKCRYAALVGSKTIDHHRFSRSKNISAFFEVRGL